MLIFLKHENLLSKTLIKFNQIFVFFFLIKKIFKSSQLFLNQKLVPDLRTKSDMINGYDIQVRYGTFSFIQTSKFNFKKTKFHFYVINLYRF